MRPLTRSKVQDATVLLRQGKSIRQVSSAVGISISSAQKIQKEDKENIPAPKIGRPSKGSERAKILLARKFSSGRLRTLREGQQYVQSTGGGRIATATVRSWLRHEGLRAYVCPRKPRLTKENKAARYKFAKDHLDWTTADWKKVMFSDETIISRVGSFGKGFYYKRPENKRLQAFQIKETLQGGGGRLLLWGCMTYHGVGDACWISGRMDSGVYLDVVKDYVVASRKWHAMDPATFLFQQDNASIHTAGIIKAFFAKSNIAVLKWPANSSDLNPIENVWSYIKYHLDQYPCAPKSMKDLWERVQDIWTTIPKHYLHELYESMPRRMMMVYRNKGGHTKY
jgi:transposase